MALSIYLCLVIVVGVWAGSKPPIHTHKVTMVNEIPLPAMEVLPSVDFGENTTKKGEAIAGESEDFDKVASSECDFPFERVGLNCYYFSEETRDFEGALSYCASLEHGHNYEVTLAMLDYSRDEDQALLTAATSKNKNFWVGGKSEDGAHWAWLDMRDIPTQAPFWYYSEPDDLNNKCATTQVTTSVLNVRSYMHDSDCSESSYFICQTGFHLDFRRIGNHYYLISQELDLGYHSWQDARDYCMSLSVPSGYHADLAVLGLPDQDDYLLINTLVMGYTFIRTWLGAKYVQGEACTYNWIDGRALDKDSILWLYNQPNCHTNGRVAIEYDPSHNRAYLLEDTDYYPLSFICQLYHAA